MLLNASTLGRQSNRRIQIETHDFANKPLNKSNPLSSEGAARAAGAVESAPKSELRQKDIQKGTTAIQKKGDRNLPKIK